MDGDTVEPLQAGWRFVGDQAIESCEMRFENGAWTIEGTIEGSAEGSADCSYAIRLSPEFGFRQFLLFRDDSEPDLWLAADRFGGWGEVNGSIRADLAGCTAIELSCSAATRTGIVRRLHLDVGATSVERVAVVDVETLGVIPVEQYYSRVGEWRWRRGGAAAPADIGATETCEFDDALAYVEFDVDGDGLAIDEPERFTRIR